MDECREQSVRILNALEDYVDACGGTPRRDTLRARAAMAEFVRVLTAFGEFASRKATVATIETLERRTALQRPPFTEEP
jgi:hypothetical protein